MFFDNANIIEHQLAVGVKLSLMRIVENTKQVQDGKLLNMPTTAHNINLILRYSSRGP